MTAQREGAGKPPPTAEQPTVLDQSALARIYPLIAARMEFYRLEYERTANPLLVWRVVQEYSVLAKNRSAAPVYPPWCCEYLESSATALGQLAAPAGLTSAEPAVPPQKARAAVADALGLVKRGRSNFHAAARDMLTTDIGARAESLRNQGYTETQTVEMLATFFGKDERTIRGQISAYRKSMKAKSQLLASFRARGAKT